MSTRRPADEDIFEDAAPAPAAVRPLVRAAEPIFVSSLAALPTARGADLELPAAMPTKGAQAYRIQAGAFSDQDNARRAAAQLASAGTATIEPMERGGTTLYRVILPGPADEAEAFAMRDRVAGIGFADARILRP
jgi:rare lipoprotein A